MFLRRLALANLITKTNFDSKLSNLNREITTNKTGFKFDSSTVHDKKYVKTKVKEYFVI